MTTSVLSVVVSPELDSSADKERVSVNHGPLNRLRDAVAHLKLEGYCISLNDELNAAIEDREQRLQREKNGGKPFPSRSGNLRGGRPKKKREQ